MRDFSKVIGRDMILHYVITRWPIMCHDRDRGTCKYRQSVHEGLSHHGIASSHVFVDARIKHSRVHDELALY